MGKRILLAGILGGVLVFFWGYVSHVLLPLGEVGIKEFPQEEPVVTALRDNITEPGFYFFPGMAGHGMARDAATMKAWEEKYRQGPRGILIYHPQGALPMEPKQLGTELVADILAALLAAWLLAQAVGSFTGYGARVVFVVVLGLFGAIATNLSYWNWYGFPTDYTLANVVNEVLGWVIAGLGMGAIVKS